MGDEIWTAFSWGPHWILSFVLWWCSTKNRLVVCASRNLVPHCQNQEGNWTPWGPWSSDAGIHTKIVKSFVYFAFGESILFPLSNKYRAITSVWGLDAKLGKLNPLSLNLTFIPKDLHLCILCWKVRSCEKKNVFIYMFLWSVRPVLLYPGSPALKYQRKAVFLSLVSEFLIQSAVRVSEEGNAHWAECLCRRCSIGSIDLADWVWLIAFVWITLNTRCLFFIRLVRRIQQVYQEMRFLGQIHVFRKQLERIGCCCPRVKSPSIARQTRCSARMCDQDTQCGGAAFE